MPGGKIVDIDMKNARLLEARDAALPKRERDTHKGDYGRLLILGGCAGYTGAPAMCARAALRAGAGLVYVGVPAPIYEVTAVKLDEAMPFPLPADADGRISLAALPALADKLARCDACVLGPGLGRGGEQTEFVRRIVLSRRGKLLLDADALSAAAEDMDMLSCAAGTVVVTPHEGEFRRMGGTVTGNPAADAAAFAARHGCITVLKGPETAVAFPDGETAVSRLGNPGMATGGSGDVLSGVIGGLLGQLPVKKAVTAGVYIHGAAGDLCAARLGEYSMLPGDIIEAIPEVMKNLVK
jgi:hydroxyethylthiazole kinase-like uncharacterized protein yjeF